MRPRVARTAGWPARALSARTILSNEQSLSLWPVRSGRRDDISDERGAGLPIASDCTDVICVVALVQAPAALEASERSKTGHDSSERVSDKGGCVTLK